ncbi:MAG: hypothetical protein HY903_12790 [Deltaproteobacteria bacterium]|nr:hypothetical protein [Deltaproteobacteria bacterium]
MVRAPAVLLLAIAVFAAITYGLVSAATPLPAEVDRLVFGVSPDSREYLSVSRWIFAATPVPDASINRPILYPLFLGLSAVAGVKAVWIGQALLWLASAVLVSLAVRRRTGSRVLMLLAGALFVGHPSLVALTYFGLTETLTVFLLALWLNVAASPGWLSDRRRILESVLLLALLTITKPVFKYALAVYLVAVVVATWRQRQGLAARLLAVSVGLAPVLIQLAVMLDAHGIFDLSRVSRIGRDRHLLPAVYCHVHERQDLEAGWAAIADLSDADKNAYLVDHWPATAVVFAHNLVDGNLTRGSEFLKNEGQAPRLWSWTRRYNMNLARLHALLVPLLLFLGWRRQALELLPVAAVGLLLLFSTGLVFWAGDRLVAFTLPIWIYVYLGLGAEWLRARGRSRSATESSMPKK